MNSNPYEITKEAKKRLKDKMSVIRQLVKGTPAKEILGFSDSVMASFHQKAHGLLQQKRFTDGVCAFTFLVTVNPYNQEYWIGLGMAAQMEGDYELALSAYEMAAIVQAESPVPYLYLAKCLFAINEKKSAMEALNMALEYSAERSIYQELRLEAIEVRRQLLKRLS